MSQYEGSPIMNYGEDDGDEHISGGCPPGYELNVVIVVIVIMALLYFICIFDNKMNEGFYVNLEAPNIKEKYYNSGVTYDPEYLTYEGGGESLYSGKDGYGRNY
jgi:hypothetical protein